VKNPPLLACHSVDFAYGRHAVIHAMGLAVERGEWVGIIGPNGAGKTTLMYLLVGHLRPGNGQVVLEGRWLSEHSPEALARRLAVVPQATPLVFGFRVTEIVAMGRHPHRGALQWRLSEEDRQRVLWAMERTGTLDLARRRFNELSGGEQQLVLIARALAQSTEVLLLDEPTASLDLQHQAQIIDVLQRLHREEGSTILWIAHDLNLVGRVSSRLVLLHRGRIARDGPPAQILTTEVLSDVYQTAITVEVRPDGRRQVDLDLGGATTTKSGAENG
jgi:iron complex transport system ATP-binding protein